MAYIHKRGDRWRAVVRKTGHATQSKTFPTKYAAEQWARSVESRIEGGETVRLAEARSTTVRKLFERFVVEVSPTHKGQRWEEVRIARLLKTADFVNRRLDQISAEDIRQWRNLRLQEISPASVNRELNLISGVFNHAIKEWGAPFKENPVHLVKRPKDTGRHRNRRWNPDEIKALLEAANWREDTPPTTGREYVGWAFLIALETAMRLGEIVSIKVADFHPAERYVALHDTKNGDARNVPLSKAALKLMELLVKGRRSEERIFPLTSESLGLYFREARNKAGLTNIRFHDTRHEAATRISQKLPNVLELSAVTGHRSLQSLKRYYNPTASELARKLD